MQCGAAGGGGGGDVSGDRPACYPSQGTEARQGQCTDSTTTTTRAQTEELLNIKQLKPQTTPPPTSNSTANTGAQFSISSTSTHDWLP